jgi:OPT oligopeptide transporter protein
MGMGVLMFDWSQISWIGSPLMGEFVVSLPFFLSSGGVFFWCVLLSLDANDGFLVPWWAEMHISIGFVVFYWILASILYYTNVRSFFTLLSINLIYPQVLGSRLLSHLLKRTFRPFWQNYNVSHVLLPNDTFNETAAYNLYSPML